MMWEIGLEYMSRLDSGELRSDSNCVRKGEMQTMQSDPTISQTNPQTT